MLSGGQIVTGRWEKNWYIIVRLLGRGGTGSVYQVKDSLGRLLAMKVSGDSLAITHEYRTLVYLNNLGGNSKPAVIPRVYEMDEIQLGNAVYNYMIMDYCPGKSLDSLKGSLKPGDAAQVGRPVAEFLHWLHRSGFVFGDLKPGNIQYNAEKGAVYIIDYGSVCLKGHGLKQYTPGYDRASWQAGTRIADEYYDMFALGMLIVTLVLGKVRGKEGGELRSLLNRVYRGMNSQLLRDVVVRALTQEARDCGEIAAGLSGVAGQAEQPVSCRRTSDFANILGAGSVLAFLLGLVYYYQ